MAGTGAQADPDVQPELVLLQVELAEWRRRYTLGGEDPAAAEALAQLARERSDQVLSWSGILG